MRYQNLDMAHPRHGFQAPRKAWAINLLREAICICFSDAGKKSKYQCRMFQTPNRTEPKSTRNRRNRNRTGTEPGLYQILETETEPNRTETTMIYSVSVWSSMGLGILLSPHPCGNPSQFGVPWGWKFGYHLTLVDNPSQFEVPWGWKFGYHPTLWTIPVNFKFHGVGKFDVILPLWTFRVNLKFHGGGNFAVPVPLWTLRVKLKFHGGGNFDIILSLWTIQISLMFHGVETLISSVSI